MAVLTTIYPFLLKKKTNKGHCNALATRFLKHDNEGWALVSLHCPHAENE